MMVRNAARAVVGMSLMTGLLVTTSSPAHATTTGYNTGQQGLVAVVTTVGGTATTGTCTYANDPVLGTTRVVGEAVAAGIVTVDVACRVYVGPPPVLWHETQGSPFFNTTAALTTDEFAAPPGGYYAVCIVLTVNSVPNFSCII